LPVKDIGRLLLRCADRPELVAAMTTFLTRAGANIISLTSTRPSKPAERSCSRGDLEMSVVMVLANHPTIPTIPTGPSRSSRSPTSRL